jgi:hypothetical protein
MNFGEPCARCGRPYGDRRGCGGDGRYLKVAQDPRPVRPGGYFDGPMGFDCASCGAGVATWHHAHCPEEREVKREDT